MPEIAAVAINIGKNLEKQVFDYLIPTHLRDKVKIGCRVQVPLGSRYTEGFIVGFPGKTDVLKLKSIKSLIDEEPIISQEMVDVAFWVSEKYLCPLYQVLEYILPPYARLKKEKWVRLVPEAIQLMETIAGLNPPIAKILSQLKKGPQKLNILRKKIGEGVEIPLFDLEKRGLVKIFDDFQAQGSSKFSTMVKSKLTLNELNEILTTELKRAPKQAEILKYLTLNGPAELSQLSQNWPQPGSAISGLERKGLVIKYKIKEERFPQVFKEFKKDKVLKLNQYQVEAVTNIKEKLEQGHFGAFLLHGVTGSGKTEVYLESIRYVLKQGRTALVLVPEISLTPQLIGRFSAVLGEQVKVLHSGLSPGERLDVWESLRLGKVKVIVGVRSAVFAPLSNLGLIIIDEEHETTFKQSEPDPRYHAREVALYRAKRNNAVLVLGSATPSLETYYRMIKGEYELINMPERVTPQPLPQVEIVDMRKEFLKGNKSIFSQRLKINIEETLARGEQIILFLNRRGYSTFVLCRECGKPLECKNCAISLTYHSIPHHMKCHYCDFTMPVPHRCPHCGSSFIRYFGAGTQQVEAEIKKIWPGVKVIRMDVDTTQNKDAHQKLLAEFGSNKSSILLGTQMIAKGLDFPNVTLVGVIAADLSLSFPDYNAGERTFQLLTQVAGRAGRGSLAGKVIIQTYNPEHYAITTGKNYAYLEFFQKELALRKQMDYPPFSSLVRILVTDVKEKNVVNCIGQIAAFLQDHFGEKIEILGPATAPIKKIKNRYRYQLILKGTDLDLLRVAARNSFNHILKGENSKTLRIIIDVEPENIL